MSRKTYNGVVDKLKENQIFVFGSNTEGRHGLGSAKFALEHCGAILGHGRGFVGQSYGLIIKNLKPSPNNLWYNGRQQTHLHEWNLDRGQLIVYKNQGDKSLSMDQIISNIEDLYVFARRFTFKEFIVTDFSKNNLSGYSPKEMAYMFSKHSIPENIVFSENFNKLVSEHE